MKKTIALAAFLVTTIGFAQKSAVFESKILPEKKYVSESVTLINMNMDVPGQGEMLMMQEVKGPFTIKTSKAGANGTIPAELTYGDVTIKQTMNGQAQEQKSPVSGTVLMGNFDNNGQFSTESVKGSELTDELKTMVSKMLEGSMKQFKFPSKALAIGDSFEDITPLSLPLGQLGSIEASTKTTLTLTKIENGIGYFDTKQDITMSGSPSGVEMKASGSGTGKAEVSLSDKFTRKNASTTDMNIVFEAAPGMNVTMKMKTVLSSTVAISNN